ncbi:MAG TPA: anti-sigma factor [Acidobacteriota bacterium]
MNFECKDLEYVLQQQEPESLQELDTHASSCAACREQLRLWNEISDTASSLKKSWDSPHLWPRIRQALISEMQQGAAADAHFPVEQAVQFPPRLDAWLASWKTALAAFALVVISLSSVWVMLRTQAPPAVPNPALSPRQLLTEQALREVESAEGAYLRSIEKLSKLARPRIEQPTTALLVSYREKLTLIDAAIADCRANIAQNRFNTHLQMELLSIYQEKQRTLQELVKEE